MATHRKAAPNPYVNVTFRLPASDVERSKTMASMRGSLGVKWTALLREAAHRGLDLMEAESQSRAAKKGIL